jgi:hypothetical protein
MTEAPADMRLAINTDKLRSFAIFIDIFIAKLGWEEHTSDWDPYLVIERDGNTTIETPEGYYLFDIANEQLVMETDEDEYIMMDTKEITKITLMR